LKGVKKADLDFDNKQVIMTVEANTAIHAGDITGAVPKKFTVEKIEVENLVVTVTKTDAGFSAKSEGGVELRLDKAEKDEAYKAVETGAGENKTRFEVGGVLKVVEEKDKDGNAVKVEVLVLSSAKAVEEEKKEEKKE
jgi:hypothetical protein